MDVYPLPSGHEGLAILNQLLAGARIDCRWNSAALCAFVCYPVELVQIKFPRRLPDRRITPEARALDQSATNGRPGVDTAVR